MLITLTENRRESGDDAIIKTISSRLAGGRKELNTEPSRVSLYCIFKNHEPYIVIVGCCGYARISINAAILTACIQLIGHSGNVDCRGLRTNAGYLRGTEKSA